MTRFVVCGEALIDLVRSRPADEMSLQSCWDAYSAGGPMNSAVALARLGADTHFLGRLSTDTFGDQLRQFLSGTGVKTDLAVTSEQPTSLAIVSLDERGVASYVFHFTDTANFGWRPEELPELQPDDWLHIASLSTVVEPGAQVLLDWVKRTEVRLSFDVNVRSSVIADPREYWARVRPWIETIGSRRGILKASDQDLDFLARSGQLRAAEDGVVALAASWVKEYDLALSLVTEGDRGATAVLRDGSTSLVAGYQIDLVDTVGAGDTFMAGFLQRYVDSGDVPAALEQGAAVSAIVCSRSGANPPTPEELAEFLRAAPARTQ